MDRKAIAIAAAALAAVAIPLESSAGGTRVGVTIAIGGPPIVHHLPPPFVIHHPRPLAFHPAPVVVFPRVLEVPRHHFHHRPPHFITGPTFHRGPRFHPNRPHFITGSTFHHGPRFRHPHRGFGWPRHHLDRGHRRR